MSGALIAESVQDTVTADVGDVTWGDGVVYLTGDWVMLSTTGLTVSTRVRSGAAEFMPRWDRLYATEKTHPEKPNYTMILPNNPTMFAMFHVSQLATFC